MPAIVNLSAIHTLRSIYQGADAFAVLCDKYSNSLFSGCSSFFSHRANYAWVMYRYHQYFNTLILPYKLGDHQTKDFLNDLLKIFPFMADENLKISLNDMERLKANKASLWSLHNIHEPSRLDYAKALLEEAWNSIITFTAEDEKKLRTLLEKETGPIYFISNTNELNVFKIRDWLSTNFSSNFPASLETSSQTDNKAPCFEIGANEKDNTKIYMVLSYNNHAFKTEGTPSLLEMVLNDAFEGNTDGVIVISQYEKDRTAAKKLKISERMIYSPIQYFENSPQETFNVL